MKNLYPALAVLALLATSPTYSSARTSEEPAKASACCTPKCEVKEGKCTTHQAKKCAKDCAARCCKPAKKGEHPKGEHPKGEHPKGEHPKG